MSNTTLLHRLTYQVVDTCNRIIEMEAPETDKRAALEHALEFITARRDQCWVDDVSDLV